MLGPCTLFGIKPPLHSLAQKKRERKKGSIKRNEWCGNPIIVACLFAILRRANPKPSVRKDCKVTPRMPPRPNVRVLRDIKARQGVADNEVSRRAYLYVARNQSLPAQVRYQAQLQLNAFGRYTRPTTVKNRCTATGRGRGVMGEFGLCRVRAKTLIFAFFFFFSLSSKRFSFGSLR